MRKWKGHWWPSRTSNPVCRVNSLAGGFDSHALPPSYISMGAAVQVLILPCRSAGHWKRCILFLDFSRPRSQNSGSGAFACARPLCCRTRVDSCTMHPRQHFLPAVSRAIGPAVISLCKRQWSSRGRCCLHRGNEWFT